MFSADKRIFNNLTAWFKSLSRMKFKSAGLQLEANGYMIFLDKFKYAICNTFSSGQRVHASSSKSIPYHFGATSVLHSPAGVSRIVFLTLWTMNEHFTIKSNAIVFSFIASKYCFSKMQVDLISCET